MSHASFTLAWYRQRHISVVATVFLAYLWSISLPSGFMPQVDRDGDIEIVLCNGLGSIGSPMQAAATEKLTQLQRSSTTDTSQSDDSSDPCQWSVFLATSVVIGSSSVATSLVTFFVTKSATVQAPHFPSPDPSFGLARGPPLIV